jgi:hypothetical protein
MINAVHPDNIMMGILQAPNESKSIELKPSILWPPTIDALQKEGKAQEIIKTILALSNTYNGGKIILGIEKDKDRYVVKGMDDKHLASYDNDMIFEQVRNYGDPEPAFQVHHVKYQDNDKEKSAIVFVVQGLRISPVICNNIRNLSKLESSVIYIRTDKPETKKITQVVEMREVVDIAVEREIELFSRRFQALAGKALQMQKGAESHNDEAKYKSETDRILGVIRL